MRHTAGLNVEGFFGYFAEEPRPTLWQVLEGQPPAKNPPVRVVSRPGREWRYSGGGYCIVQQALINVYRQTFAEVMYANVLKPVGMADSFFIERLGGRRTARAAYAHRSNGAVLESKWLGYPELAAGGLWSSPSDLARFLIAVQRARHGDSSAGLSTSTAQNMLGPTIRPDYGLGLQLPQPGYFGHHGANPGYTARMLAHEEGFGAVLMANSEHGPALFTEMLATIAAEYRWPKGFTRFA